jgi:hypothetical protein
LGFKNLYFLIRTIKLVNIRRDTAMGIIREEMDKPNGSYTLTGNKNVISSEEDRLL